MTRNNVYPLNTDSGETRNKIFIAIEGDDYQRDLDEIGLSFDSSENEILNRVRPIVQEIFGVDIRDDSTGWLYKVRKAVNNRNIYLIPNSVAGF